MVYGCVNDIVGLDQDFRIFLFAALHSEQRIGKHLLGEQCRVIQFQKKIFETFNKFGHERFFSFGFNLAESISNIISR